jgi:hypothetical protein
MPRETDDVAVLKAAAETRIGTQAGSLCYVCSLGHADADQAGSETLVR